MIVAAARTPIGRACKGSLREMRPGDLTAGIVRAALDSRLGRRRPRAGAMYEAVSTLKPVFRPDGTVTAGNCCPLNDGAAALVVMSEVRAAELGLTPLARVVSTGVTGLSPEIMGLGPVEASRRALALADMTIDDIDLIEINEAFAVEVLASQRDGQGMAMIIERLVAVWTGARSGRRCRHGIA